MMDWIDDLRSWSYLKRHRTWMFHWAIAILMTLPGAALTWLTHAPLPSIASAFMAFGFYFWTDAIEAADRALHHEPQDWLDHVMDIVAAYCGMMSLLLLVLP